MVDERYSENGKQEDECINELIDNIRKMVRFHFLIGIWHSYKHA